MTGHVTVGQVAFITSCNSSNLRGVSITGHILQIKTPPLRKVRELVQDPQGANEKGRWNLKCLGLRAQAPDLMPHASLSPRDSAPGRGCLETQSHKAGVGRLSSSVRIRETSCHLKEANRFGGETKRHVG